MRIKYHYTLPAVLLAFVLIAAVFAAVFASTPRQASAVTFDELPALAAYVSEDEPLLVTVRQDGVALNDLTNQTGAETYSFDGEYAMLHAAYLAGLAGVAAPEQCTVVGVYGATDTRNYTVRIVDNKVCFYGRYDTASPELFTVVLTDGTAQYRVSFFVAVDAFRFPLGRGGVIFIAVTLGCALLLYLIALTILLLVRHHRKKVRRALGTDAPASAPAAPQADIALIDEVDIL